MDTDLREQLLGRAVDRTADTADWNRLELLAADDPTVWADLAETLRIDSGLKSAIFAVAAGADRVFAAEQRSSGVFLRPWLGWAAALILGLVWGATAFLDDSRSATPGGLPADAIVPFGDLTTVQNPSLPTIDPDRFVGTLPTMVVGFRPAVGQSGTEVILLRRFLEKGLESEVMMLAEDEHGRPAAIPVGLSGFPFTESL